MNFIQNFFKSRRRDAVARAVLPMLWANDLVALRHTADPADMRMLPPILAAVAYQIADAMEEARNR